MTQVVNGITVPINADGYNLTADLATMAGGVKQYTPALSKRTTGSASGNLTVATGWIDNGGTITVPAQPFGAGVQYDIRFTAQCAPTITTATNGGAAIRVQIDGVSVAQAQIQSPGNQTILCTDSLTISDNLTHTVKPQITALNQSASFTAGSNISYLQVTLVPSVGF